MLQILKVDLTFDPAVCFTFGHLRELKFCVFDARFRSTSSLCPIELSYALWRTMGIASQKDSAFIACVQDLRWIRESCRRGCLSSCVEHLLQWTRCWCRPHVTLWGPKLVFTVVSLCGPWTQSNSLSFYVARRALYFAQLQDMWISYRLSSKAAGTDHV